MPEPRAGVATHGTITLGRTRRELVLDGLRMVESVYAPGATLTPHAHEHANVSVVFEGEFHERLEGDAVVAAPISYVVKPRCTVHANHYGRRPVRSFVIEIDPRRERELGLESFGSAHWSHGGRAIAALLEVYAAFTAGADDLVETAMSGLREVVSRSDEARVRPLGRQAQATLRRAERVLRAEPGHRLSSGELAQHIGVHPVYLARLFRAAYGSSLRAFRKHLQVLTAARSLTETAETTSAVALSAGFADQSHLSRSFRSELGISPATFRRLVSA